MFLLGVTVEAPVWAGIYYLLGVGKMDLDMELDPECIVLGRFVYCERCLTQMREDSGIFTCPFCNSTFDEITAY